MYLSKFAGFNKLCRQPESDNEWKAARYEKLCVMPVGGLDKMSGVQVEKLIE